LEEDPGFQSGPWIGWYVWFNRDVRHRMDLHLTFDNASIHGDGMDDVGRFLLHGRYDVDSRDCWWTKTYPGSHQVYYRGAQRGKMITGRWEILAHGSGGFCIWPKAFGELTGEYFLEEQVVEAPSMPPVYVEKSGSSASSPGSPTHTILRSTVICSNVPIQMSVSPGVMT
jgi:hypothetical protein